MAKEHSPDTRQVNFWVPAHVLDRWDAHCKGEGIRRSQLIIQAVNNWIVSQPGTATTTTQPTTNVQELEAKLESQFQGLQGMLEDFGKKAAARKELPTSDLNARVFKLVAGFQNGIRSDELADLLATDEETILAVLTMNKAFKIAKDGTWSVNE